MEGNEEKHHKKQTQFMHIINNAINQPQEKKRNIPLEKIQA